MEETLSMDNILGQDEIDSLFTDSLENDEPSKEETQEDAKDPPEKKKEESKTTEVDIDELFDSPEGVSSEENIEEKEDTTPDKGSTSPNKLYSSIAKAFAEEGIFPDLDDEAISNVKSPEDLRDLVEQQIKSGLDERQKRIDEALNAGVETSTIKRYESTINYLDSITEEALNSETAEGEKLRKQLIYQDYINRGFSQQRATKEVQKAIDNGTDIDDAKEALQGTKEFFKAQYKTLIDDAKREEALEIEERKKQAAELKDSILSDKKVFGDLEVDNNTRKKIYENISKPVYKDNETGELYTAIQKYEMENRTDFLKYIGLVYTLTDGFKNLDGLIKNKVRKETKKGLRELEHTLNNTARNTDGSLRFTSGVNEDPESFIGKGWDLDV